MRYIIAVLLTFSFASADYLVEKSLACPSVMLLHKAPTNNGESGMDITLYSIANNCLILSRDDKVEAIGYDPRDSKEIYQQIIYKKTGEELFVVRDNLIVEQGGKENRIRF